MFRLRRGETRQSVDCTMCLFLRIVNIWNTYGDSDVISMPAGFRRHLVGKALINVFFTVIALKYALLARQ